MSDGQSVRWVEDDVRCEGLLKTVLLEFRVERSTDIIVTDSRQRCTVASSSVKATFKRGSLLLCTAEGHPQSTYRWLDVSSDRVVSNSSELDVCDVQTTTSPRDLRCVVTVNVHGEEFDVIGNISADEALWTAVRSSCSQLKATNSK